MLSHQVAGLTEEQDRLKHSNKTANDMLEYVNGERDSLRARLAAAEKCVEAARSVLYIEKEWAKNV